MLAAVPDEELLALLLDRPHQGLSDLGDLLNLSQHDLVRQGFSTNEANKIVVAAEIARRHQPRLDVDDRIMEPRSFVSMLANLRNATVAKAVAFLLDKSAHCISFADVGTGSDGCPTGEATELVGVALGGRATFLLVAHKHLERCIEPTASDIRFTVELESACRKFGIDLADHVIVSRRAWFSFRASSILDV